MAHESLPVIVLGAGAAGLAAAHELNRNGRAVTLVEAAPRVGGLCRTLEHRGYRFDLGGHRWFTKNADLDAWFHRLLGPELVPVDRISRVHFEGRYFQYPIEVGDLLRKLGPRIMLDAGLRCVYAGLVQALAAEPPKNMRQAYIAQFGSRLYEMFFRRYSEKVWGQPCEQLSADWVSQRSKGLSLWTLLKDALRLQREPVTSLIDRFYYPATGYARLPERMAEDIVARGGELRLSTRVRSVRWHGPEDLEVVCDREGQTEVLRGSAVLSTVPLGALVGMLDPACPAPVVEAARGLVFRDLITVNLILKRPQVSTDTWVYVQDESVLFGRLHEPKNWSPAMVPDAGTTSLVLECFCSRGDAIWSLDDAALRERCVRDLVERLHLIEAEDVVDAFIVRTTHAYPVYDLGYAERIATIRAHLDTLPGLHILGRSGTFRYNNADHSVEMGLLLAQRMLGARLDHLAVNTEPTYQEIVRPGEEPARDRFQLGQPAARP
ncbi:FAD-dependent oxidoreductase [Aquariibacter albus]|uniref:FAD-dependent oxidoreductase n=1 Tax=Aquariibacter albus TaxID=2759899 RepID=A0A839HM22_9BURK|nr:FAD-dependent oxidoreductase [Aquariibacter albus]MBB1163323.1 FAD-dependent oxidoreductase [Aquariibacter albus]